MIDTTIHKEFGNALLAEIQQVVDDTARLCPENFNVLSKDIALDYNGLPTDIPVSGLACINSIDYQKMRDMAMFLKTNRRSYTEKRIVINKTTLYGEEAIDVEGVAIGSASGITIQIKTPTGFDGRRAIVTWLTPVWSDSFDETYDTAVVRPDSVQNIWDCYNKQLIWPINKQLIGGEQGFSIMVSQQETQVKIRVEYNRSGENEKPFKFPGMTVFVKYYREAK